MRRPARCAELLSAGRDSGSRAGGVQGGGRQHVGTKVHRESLKCPFKSLCLTKINILKCQPLFTEPCQLAHPHACPSVPQHVQELAGRYTRQQVAWALSLVHSRSFAMQGSHVWVPGIDLCNHTLQPNAGIRCGALQCCALLAACRGAAELSTAQQLDGSRLPDCNRLLPLLPRTPTVWSTGACTAPAAARAPLLWRRWHRPPRLQLKPQSPAVSSWWLARRAWRQERRSLSHTATGPMTSFFCFSHSAQVTTHTIQVRQSTQV